MSDQEKLSGQDEAPLGGAWHGMARPTDEAVASSVSPRSPTSVSIASRRQAADRWRDDRRDPSNTLVDAHSSVTASPVSTRRSEQTSTSHRVIAFISDTSAWLDVASVEGQRTVVDRASDAAGLRIGAYVLGLSRQSSRASWGPATRDLFKRAHAGSLDAVVLTDVGRLADDHDTALLAAVLLAERGVHVLEAAPKPLVAAAGVTRGPFPCRCFKAFSQRCPRRRSTKPRRRRC